MIRDLSELTADARTVAQEYLDDAAVAGLDSDHRDTVLADLRSFLCENLDATASPDQVRALVTQTGPTGDEPHDSRLRTFWKHLFAGFDPRAADSRIATRWWNPAEERLFVPRAIGWGVDLNFGALAVRLGLIEPDAEAEPFTTTPESAFKMAAAVPVALAVATGLHYAVRGRSLPERLPAHWNLAGSPDRWVSKRRAATTDLAVTIASAAIGVFAARSGRPGPNRAGVLAVASQIAAAGAAVTVRRSFGDRPRLWAGPATVLVISGAASGVLLGLAQASRVEEVLADLQRNRNH